LEANLKNKIEFVDGTNGDIIKVLENNFPAARRQVKQFSKRFEANTIEQIAENVFNFLKQNVTYVSDGSEHQKIRLPARLIHDKVGDCKSFALFSAAILSHYTEVGFRYSSYRNDPTPTHVYAIAKDEDNNTIIIDAVWHTFNDEKNYKHKKDHWMKISTLSGIEAVTEIPKILVDEFTYTSLKNWNNVLNSAPKNSKEHKMAIQHINELLGNIGLDKKSIEKSKNLAGIGKHHWWDKYKDKVNSALKGAWNGFKHVYPAFSAMRNSFLLLVDINYRGLGSRITAQIKKDPTKLEKLWHQNFGGNFEKLKKAAERGAKHKAFLGQPKGIKGPEVVLAIIASAAPILAAISSFLPKHKPEPGEQPNPGTDPTIPGYDPRADPEAPEFDPVYAAKHPNPGGQPPPEIPGKTDGKLPIYQEIIENGVKVIKKIADIVNPQDQSGATPPIDEWTKPKKEPSNILPIVLIGGAAVTAVVLFTRKK
jgi:hypothetical protein